MFTLETSYQTCIFAIHLQCTEYTLSPPHTALDLPLNKFTFFATGGQATHTHYLHSERVTTLCNYSFCNYIGNKRSLAGLAQACSDLRHFQR